VFVVVATGSAAFGGPYGQPGINGYVHLPAMHHADPLDLDAVINPIFRGWATGVYEYTPADQAWSGAWNDPNKALGPVTGQNFDIVSLGELTRPEIDQGIAPGSITLIFGDPCDAADGSSIRNGKGYDFAVFENGFASQVTTSLGSYEGKMIAELAYVEVSSNGRDFARFPSISLTPGRTGAYGTLETSDVHNLAGKHPNANGVCIGTPFDLGDLVGHLQVLSGAVDLNDIRYVRIVDVPGSGDFFDDAVAYVDPQTWPDWGRYPQNHPIYDAWPTWGSGGFDLEAVGVLHEQRYPADINLDGTVNHADLAVLAGAWHARFGDATWSPRCDLAGNDLFIDGLDFARFAAQWQSVERWRPTPGE
jgi:hypothetical protein